MTRRASADLTPAALALLVFALSRWFILFQFTPIASDVDRYFDYAARAFDRQQIAYSDTLQIEYPPVAWWVMSGVRRLSGDPLPNPAEPAQVAATRARYVSRFRQLMFVADLLSLVLIIAIVRRRRPKALAVTLLAYTVATALLAHVLYDRLDMIALLLFLLWAYGWSRSSGAIEIDRAASAFHAVAWSAVGISIAYRVIPVLIVPFLLLADGLHANRIRRLSVAGLILVLTIAVPAVLQYAWSGPDVVRFLTFQSERGIEIESLFASIMWAGHLVGAPIAVTLSHGGANLAGPLAASMKLASTIGIVALVGGLWFLMFQRPGADPAATAFRYACLALAGAVILSNVLSPQFLVWALPAVLLLVVELVGANTRAHLGSAIVVVLIAALTTWVFPYHFYYFGDSTPLGLVPINLDMPLPPSSVPFVVIAVRNLMFLLLVVWIARRATSPAGPAQPAARR